MTEAKLIAVRTEVVLDVMVASIHEESRRRAAREGTVSPEALGRHARSVERERFAPARAPMPWLAELLRDRDAADVAAALAAEEPAERADPGSGAPSWRVPGPGGHVRHYLGVRSGDKAAWMRGFLASCCAEIGDG